MLAEDPQTTVHVCGDVRVHGHLHVCVHGHVYGHIGV
jgi:hypothetical protein